MSTSPRLLFILKYRDNYQQEFVTEENKLNTYFSSGLLNSATFVVDMLKDSGVEAKLVQVIDNNCIDREVTAYKPTHVIIEAFWVVPDKFDILQKLHPTVQWIVRGHSEIPFLSNEGIAVDWLNRCVRHPNVSIATNSLTSLHDLRVMIQAANKSWNKKEVAEKVLYLPNYYPTDNAFTKNNYDGRSDELHIGCFGAIRPLKNNLLQAIAAIKFANLKGKKLRFYINSSRKEQGGDNNYKNLKALFDHNEHQLVEVPWVSHSQFLQVLRTMDISMNVSFTETFNIVAADSVVSGAVIITSPQVYWSSCLSQANPTSVKSIVKTMLLSTDFKFYKFLKYLNLRKLKSCSEQAKKQWLSLYKTNHICD